ncbi:DUF2486 family protein [Burkholderia cepacia]|uniref:DUF2486 family protein n=1 Tax=Burkholderia cepacia TaxID=292 RepID=UPI001C934EAD|nr:DUF2486 family protein [Burkholderia cepacia]MBY4712494.1 DUF2486 family protein [Burkholderia cepacia]MBY4737671.1 DUF2486 family protein [Burkholderia cepacia]MBY4746827.1 DUF2486 family protein [Burkholderia cepacia]MBY4759267.1 DUF2486 family protein [Burkholderia cepacia]MBY4776619.1 DUF2486 family protein [Burkholderia cepacia]
MTEADSSSIPTLTDVLVPGKPVPARGHAPDAPRPAAGAAIPVLTDVVAPRTAGAAPADSMPAALDPDSVVVEPVSTPHVPAVELPGDEAVETATVAAAALGEIDAPAEPGAAEHVVAEDSAAMSAPLRSSLADDDVLPHAFAAVAREAVGHAREAHMPEAVAPAPAAAAAPQQDAQAVAGLTPEDAQHIAERLRNRLTNYLTGEGRDAIEARCRDALHEHSAWLVGQITREVALALETEVMDWVRDAVDEEIARRRAGHAG